jgi:[glutamine synthetase] adenylyltransferase / [glutamine synthetase]-adenylyl-L-tyrosine phosphorylase
MNRGPTGRACYTRSVLEALDRLIDALDTRTAATPELAAELGLLGPLAAALYAGPSPRESLLQLRQLVAADADRAWPTEGKALRAAAAVLSSGPELPRQLGRRPARLALLAEPLLGRAWSRDELAAELDPRLAGLDDPTAVAEAFAAFRNDHYVRLAAAEFGLASLEQVGQELATLADVCLDRAIAFAVAFVSRGVGGEPLWIEEGQQRPCRLAAIAMGKYGAQELNFCSDIDIIFVYSSDEGQAGSLTLHEFFTKVCQQVTRLLSEATAEGFAFRVDLRLRPEGARGPICNSLDGAERYYEAWGGPYDRLAWLKARAAAGDLALGAEMVRTLRPFVFPRSTRPEVVQQIQELNLRIKQQQRQQAELGWNVKLDAGGIREVEFFVQALQLLHAGKQEALQERGTLRALDKLLFAGLIAEHEHRQLGESYELWRRLEHRLQLHDGRQTHLLPADGPLRRHVALHLGYEPPRFEAELAARRAQVSAIYATLGAAAQAATAEEGDERFAPLLDPELSATASTGLLADAGFGQPERALEQLELLAAKPWGPLGRARAAGSSQLALALLAELARSPDPDAALLHLVELTLRLGPYDGLWTMLEGSRPTLRLLCSLFGSSDYLARLFLGHPELLDGLLGTRACAVVAAARMRRELAARLGAVEQGDLEARFAALRRYRTEEVLRIGMCDIAGDLEIEQVWEQLSDLADAILEQVYAMVLAEATARYGTPRLPDGSAATMVVIGLGKHGGRELTYASDLDMIFIYSAPAACDGARHVESGEFFARVAQRLISALTMALDEGTLYQVDTRLRPSGKQGTLVSSLEAFQDYHRTAAQTWERQVLIKARPVCGDAALGREVERTIRSFIFVEAAAAPLRAEIAQLRARMEKELAEESGGFYNLKLGRGGLLDIDFIVQYLQLAHGVRDERLQVRSTLTGLAALEEARLIDGDMAAILRDGYRFLRRIESRLRIVRDRSAEHLPATAEGLEVMARRLGYRQQQLQSAGARLLADYRERTAAIRDVYERILGAER